MDATPNKRMSAETLADWGVLKARQKEALRYGHKYSGLVRLVLVHRGTSWVAPEDIERIGTAPRKRFETVFKTQKTQPRSNPY